MGKLCLVKAFSPGSTLWPLLPLFPWQQQGAHATSNMAGAMCNLFWKWIEGLKLTVWVSLQANCAFPEDLMLAFSGPSYFIPMHSAMYVFTTGTLTLSCHEPSLSGSVLQCCIRMEDKSSLWSFSSPTSNPLRTALMSRFIAALLSFCWDSFTQMLILENK